jgi:predicted Zn-dependent peptidase
VIVGDRSEEQLLDLAAAMFDPWRAAASTMTIDRSAGLTPPPSTPLATLAVIHRPGAAQSELRIGHVCAARSTPDYSRLLVLNAILGGEFVSRLNLNLRESKGYTYGVRTGFNLRRGMGPSDADERRHGRDGPAILEALAGSAIAGDAQRPLTR